MIEEEGYTSPEEGEAALAFEQAESASNLELAQRMRSTDNKYDEFGYEKQHSIELVGEYERSTIAQKARRRVDDGLSPVCLFSTTRGF